MKFTRSDSLFSAGRTPIDSGRTPIDSPFTLDDEENCLGDDFQICLSRPALQATLVMLLFDEGREITCRKSLDVE